MKKKIFIFVLALIAGGEICNGQAWIDTLYQIQVQADSVYGHAVDFAGNERELKMDIAFPLDDEPPECGRPLLIGIHGGAFISGSKSGGIMPRVLSDFAKRGYVTASIDYRLGMFHTHQQHHCNISALDGVEWDCLNMADTTEWHRAYFRSIQDAKGAIRYMVNHASEFQINPENIFLFGESAGGFTALGAGFLDDITEIPFGTNAMPDVLAPNQIYDVPCVQTFGLDTNIASMNLARPDLGSFEGWLNYPANAAYSVKGIGSFYGGVFDNIFLEQGNDSLPAVYLFHQPNDLIVPYNCNGVFAGYSYCATMFPFNCAGILNRAEVCGGQGIVNMIDDIAAMGLTVPEYQLAHTSNNADCFTQIVNPALGGHQLDSYWLRTTEMATFFAPHIDTCTVVTSASQAFDRENDFQIFPNPVNNKLTVLFKARGNSDNHLWMYNIVGNLVYEKVFQGSEASIILNRDIPNGTYVLVLNSDGRLITKKVIVLR